LEDKRSVIEKEPENKLTKEEKEEIIEISCSPEYIDKPPKKIVIDLLDKEIYIASASSFRRVLIEKAMNKHREEIRKRKQGRKPKELEADGPNQVWSWDITYLKTDIRGKFYYLYMMIDVWSREIVGYRVEERESGEYASRMLEESVKRRKAYNIVLHSDNGGPMKSANLYEKMNDLNVIPSHSRPRVSNDNAYSEALFRTTKYDVNYPRIFYGIEEAREWVKKFVNWYNNEHKHSAIGYVTPRERYEGKDEELFEKRNRVMQEAAKKHPKRFGKVKKWEKEEKVYLNKRNGVNSEVA